MTIKTIERTEIVHVFCAQCSNCGAEGSVAGNEKVARELVLEDGWESEILYQGGQAYEALSCPHCIDEWRKEDEAISNHVSDLERAMSENIAETDPERK